MTVLSLKTLGSLVPSSNILFREISLRPLPNKGTCDAPRARVHFTPLYLGTILTTDWRVAGGEILIFVGTFQMTFLEPRHFS